MSIQVLPHMEWLFGARSAAEVSQRTRQPSRSAWLGLGLCGDASVKELRKASEDSEYVIVEDDSVLIEVSSDSSKDDSAGAQCCVAKRSTTSSTGESFEESGPALMDTISEGSTEVGVPNGGSMSWELSTASPESIQRKTPHVRIQECPEHDSQLQPSEVCRCGEQQLPVTHQSVERTQLPRRTRTLERLLHRRKSRRLSTTSRAVVKAANSIPHECIPERSAPLFARHIPDLALPAIADAFLGERGCVIQRFMSDVLECYDFKATGWAESEDGSGDMVRGLDYKSSIPADVPPSVARLCRLPETVNGSTLMRLHRNDSFVMVVQHSHTHNVMYGERFFLKNTLAFQKDPTGGVVLSQWTDVVWVEPLPWTHGICKYFIERKAKASAKDTADDFVRIIREAA